jgi:CxxC motif-containing protein
MSGSSLAISQNTYVKVYNSADVLTIVKTDKDIRKHVYEKGKKYIVDWAKAKALGITTRH